MKKFSFLVLILSLLSCNDGNFDRPEFQFSNIAINQCGDLVLYKINGSEALFIKFNESDITNQTAETTFSISTTRSVTYRVFDASVSSAYFCNDIPPTSPNTLRNWVGSGTISIDSKEELDSLGIGSGTFSHQINLLNFVLTSEQGSLSFDNYDFGIFETTTEPN